MNIETSRPYLGPDPTYGSVDFYKSQFDDILADIGCSSDDGENNEVALTVLQAFELSINEWISYHQSCANSYTQMLDKFLYGKQLDRT